MQAVVPEFVDAMRALRSAGVKWAVNTGRTLGHMDDGLVREFGDAVLADIAPALAVLAVAMERYGAAHGIERTVALVAMLGEQLGVEQPPPQHDRLAGKLGVELVGDPRDRHPRVQPDHAPLGLARDPIAGEIWHRVEEEATEELRKK